MDRLSTTIQETKSVSHHLLTQAITDQLA